MGDEIAKAHKADKPCTLCDGVDERGEDDVLHPGADGGTKAAEPHRAEVTILKNRSNGADLSGIEASIAIDERFLGFAAELLLRCELVLGGHRA